MKRRPKPFKCQFCFRKYHSRRGLDLHLGRANHQTASLEAPKTPEKRQEEEKLTDISAPTPEFKLEELSPEKTTEALFFIWDLLDRSQIKFLLLKDLARQVKETQTGITPNLHVKTLELGILRRYLTSQGAPMLKGLFKMYKVEPEWTDTFIRFEYSGVPIFIKIIQRSYGFFNNPAIAFYRTQNFEVPNPFDGYWAARFIIK